MLVEKHCRALFEGHPLPLAPGFRGASPMPVRYLPVAQDVFTAEYKQDDASFVAGLQAWLRELGRARRYSFYALPDNLVRYEIATQGEYRVGLWRQKWEGEQLVAFAPVEETLVRRSSPLFDDVTAHAFGGTSSFREQLLKGNTWWRSRLDAATGIDIYSNNGIAAGDIDNDGVDEIYVCQPAGLPNRLYRRGPDARFTDVTDKAGLAILDDTKSALFLDLRNCGLQDLVVLCASGPQLYLNKGDGTFRHLPDAFRFRHAPQGSFTGMAAADFNRDGRLDLYLCCYIYFQSEDQYRYPVPYQNAQNGPPNFLFRNNLSGDGGFFEDVTEASGLNQNNNRYSFAAAWCDVEGKGWPDLYVSNDFGRNNFYRNQGGTFLDEAEKAGVLNIGPAMSAAWFDYDGDGRPDLYVSNMWTEAGQRLTRAPEFVPSRTAAEDYQRHAKGNNLFRNAGNGRFEESSAREQVEMGRWAWSADAFDFDCDGTPEIYVTCGMLTNPSETDLNSFFWRQVVGNSPTVETAASAYEDGWNAINQFIREDYSWCGREPNVFYRRSEPVAGHPVRYYDYSGVSGLDFADDSRAFAVLDVDGDGYLDIVLKNRMAPQVRVLRNNCATGKRVAVLKLRGTKSNRDAIGARVEVDGRVQWISAGSGFLSQHTKDLHFALSRSSSAKILWPSGEVQQIDSIEPGWRYEIEEGSAQCKRTPLAARQKIAASAAGGVKNDPAPRATWLLEPVPLPERRRGPGFLLLHAGQIPAWASDRRIEVVDLTTAPEEVAAAYSLFCRYLFEYRAIGLRLPLLLLIDGESRAHKVYFELPPVGELWADLSRMNSPERAGFALPFAGQYINTPHRNYFKLAAAFYWAGYPNQALPYFNEELRRNPDNWKCLNAVGEIYWESGNYSAALKAFERATELKPALVPALLGAGECYVKLGQADRGEKLFRRCLELEPNNADAANQLGLLCSETGRMDEAKRLFQLAIESRRDHAPAINNLGVLYVKAGAPTEAIAVFRYGIEAAPDNEELYLNLGRVYVMLGDREHAREIMQQLLARKPESTIAAKALSELRGR